MRSVSLLLFCFTLAVPRFAEAVATEAALKAAFLFKFAGYVEWPSQAFARAEAPFVIAVVGADDIAVELERAVQGRTIQDRPIAVRRASGAAAARGAHMVFVGRTAPGGQAVLAAAQAAGALAVSEGIMGLDNGAAINFVTVDDRIAFEVSLDAAERAGLRISSRMLSVARRVVPRPRTSGVPDTELALHRMPREAAATRTLA